MENKVYSQVYSILKTSKEGVLDAIRDWQRSALTESKPWVPTPVD